jgi:hypothetical protein
MDSVKKKSKKAAAKKNKKGSARKKKAARGPKMTIISRKPLIIQYGSGRVPQDIIDTYGPPCPGIVDQILRDRGP